MGADMLGFSWSRVIGGKSTALAGCSMVNAVPFFGGLMPGALVLCADPGSADGLAVAQYMRFAISGAGGGVYADNIIRESVSVAQTGYLRCSGALVNKTACANLYNVVGGAYSAFVASSSCKPWGVSYCVGLDRSAGLLGFAEIQGALPIPSALLRALVV